MKTIKIPARKIIGFIIIYTIVVSSLSSEMELPQNLLYVNDILLIFVLFAYSKKMNMFEKLGMKKIIYVLCFLALVIAVGVIGNMVSLKLVLWGMRNTFRGIIFFIFCVWYLKYEDVQKMFHIFVKLQYVNFALGIYQFFILGLEQDTVGGIFGHGNGNALCIFCVIVCAYTILSYLNEKKNLFNMIFCLGSSFILAALAEEKFLFIEIVITFLIALAISRRNYAKLIIIPVFVFVTIMGLQIFESIFPKAAKDLMSVSLMEKYATSSWLGSYYIPRIGSYTFISEKIFQNNLFNKLFGFGMGNCDTSSFSFLQSNYYNKYGYMNYRWIFRQWTIMENGIIGFWGIVAFFVIVNICLAKIRKKVSVDRRIFIDTSLITSIISIMTMWMNNTLKVDTAYIPYFVIASGIVCYKKIVEKNNQLGGNEGDT